MMMKELPATLIRTVGKTNADIDEIMRESAEIEMYITGKEFAKEYYIRDVKTAKKRLENALCMACTKEIAIRRTQ